MNTSARNVLIGLAVIVVLGVMGYAYMRNSSNPPISPEDTPPALIAPPGVEDKYISDGVIYVHYNSSEWGLATNPTQILAKSYIPACSEPFAYCLYYTGGDYAGTNFESAGLRIAPRSDLKTETLCLNTPPEGFDASRTKPVITHSGRSYRSSEFSNVGDAGAGHMASGSLYRLYITDNSKCYEFETRVGQTQFANYPAGTVQEFTAADKAALEVELVRLINSVSTAPGADRLF